MLCKARAWLPSYVLSLNAFFHSFVSSELAAEIASLTCELVQPVSAGDCKLTMPHTMLSVRLLTIVWNSFIKIFILWSHFIMFYENFAFLLKTKYSIFNKSCLRINIYRQVHDMFKRKWWLLRIYFICIFMIVSS